GIANGAAVATATGGATAAGGATATGGGTTTGGDTAAGGGVAALGATAARFGAACQLSRVEVPVSAAPVASRNSAVTSIWPANPSGGMTETPEISVADTRHSLEPTRLPDVSRAPGVSPLMDTNAPGGGAPT